MMDPHHCARIQLGKLVNNSIENSGSLAFLDLWKCYDIKPSLIYQSLYTSTSLVSTTIVVGSLILLVLKWRRLRHSSSCIAGEGARRPGLQRSVSFTSSMMAAVVLPERLNMPEPVINIFIEFGDKQCPTDEDVKKLVVAKLLQYDRLGKIPKLDSKEQLHFLNDISYDSDRLVRRIPWWEILILENQQGGNSACLWRIHHALGDGISLATVAQHILEYADGTPFTSVIPAGMMEKRSNKQTKMALTTMAWKLISATAQVFAMPLGWSDDPTVFSKGMHLNMVHSREREVVLFPTLPLDFIKAMKNVANVSINDVLFTCLSQAIRDYLDEQECPVVRKRGANLLCRALIAAVLPRPVNETAADTLRNKWFFLSSDLGVGVSHDNNDILERLQYLHTHLSSLKTSPVPMVGLAMQNQLMRFTPRILNEQSFFNVMAKRSVSISNVPGPAKTCLFAGQAAVGCNMFLSNITPHVAFISYAGNVFGNITLDPEAIPNCQSLAKHLRNAVVKLADRLEIPVPKEL